MEVTIRIREISALDNKPIASIIREVLKEHGVDKPGTVYTDPTTDKLYELFQQAFSCYFIAELDGEMVGGCGIYPTLGLPEGCAELVKLYLSKKSRKRGIGHLLMTKCLEKAKELGFNQLYLESLPELDKAVQLYKSLGFKTLDNPMGQSGHFACNLWMLKELD
jgi:putative acetyltransferase